jgi:hypothetical protein
MAIKPIDMQTNIQQMHEIAKNEHSKSTINVEMQHSLEKESDKKSTNIQSRLEENKKAEKTLIMKDEEGRKRKRSGRDRKDNQSQSSINNDKMKDDKIGIFIDVKK